MSNRYNICNIDNLRICPIDGDKSNISPLILPENNDISISSDFYTLKNKNNLIDSDINNVFKDEKKNTNKKGLYCIIL